MKYVAVRILKQWNVLKEYFLKFLPKQSNFKSPVAATAHCECISLALQNLLTEGYISFCAFSASDCKDFGLLFLSDELKIHLLYSLLCKLVSNLMEKFI